MRATGSQEFGKDLDIQEADFVAVTLLVGLEGLIGTENVLVLGIILLAFIAGGGTRDGHDTVRD